MISYAYINISTEWPFHHYVSKSVETSLSLIYLNKLKIPDVMIDIIKDYIYISAEEILRKFHQSEINLSIQRLSIDARHYVDEFGRRRLTHWTIGHMYCPNPEIRMQQTLCITCGETCSYHDNFTGCCELEWDAEDGTIDFQLAEPVADPEPEPVAEEVIMIENPAVLESENYFDDGNDYSGYESGHTGYDSDPLDSDEYYTGYRKTRGSICSDY